MDAPAKTREQLIADERDAEATVVEAENAWLVALAVGTPESIAEKQAAVDAARETSRAVRKAMTDGLAEWTRYAAWQEAVAHAEANGLPTPTLPAPAPTPEG